VRFLATAEAKNFQPMNTNWALVPDLEPEEKPIEFRNRKKLGKREKRPILFARGQRDFAAWLEQTGFGQTKLELTSTH
jgi:methylenetetrahydrofolate--tRNA-(uracil-5-)-methyltransferase